MRSSKNPLGALLLLILLVIGCAGIFLRGSNVQQPSSSAAGIVLPFYQEEFPPIRHFVEGASIDVTGDNRWYCVIGGIADACVAIPTFLNGEPLQRGYPSMLFLEVVDGTNLAFFSGLNETPTDEGGVLRFDEMFDLRFDAAPRIVNGAGNDEDIRFGFSYPGWAEGTGPDAGYYFEKLGTDSNWFAVRWGPDVGQGVEQRVNTGVAHDNTFMAIKQFRIFRVDSTNVGFSIDGSTPVSVESEPFGGSEDNLYPFYNVINPMDGGAMTTVQIFSDRWAIWELAPGAKRVPMSIPE